MFERQLTSMAGRCLLIFVAIVWMELAVSFAAWQRARRGRQADALVMLSAVGQRAALSTNAYHVRGAALGESHSNLAGELARFERFADDAALADAR